MKKNVLTKIILSLTFLFSTHAMASTDTEITPGQKFYNYCENKSRTIQNPNITLQDAKFLLQVAKESASDHLIDMRWHGGSEFMDELFQDETFFRGLQLCYPESDDTRMNFVYLMFAADLLAKQGSEVAITITGVKFFQFIKLHYGARATKVIGNAFNVLAGLGIGASVYGLCQKYLNKKYPLKQLQDLNLADRIRQGLTQNQENIQKLEKYHKQFPDDEMISTELENQKRLYQESLELLQNSQPVEKHTSMECVQDLYHEMIK